MPESSDVHMVAITSNGVRLYYSTVKMHVEPPQMIQGKYHFYIVIDEIYIYLFCMYILEAVNSQYTLSMSF